MGIHNFFSWIKENYSDAIMSPKIETEYDHGYFDINYFLHYSIYKCQNTDAFLLRLSSTLNWVFKKITFNKSVTFVLDGAPPYAKVVVQKKRRQGISEEEVNQLNFLHLTPGTELMIKITHHLKGYLKEQKVKHPNLKFYLSSASIPGEGDIKICSKVLKSRSGTHLIICKDADLISMATSLNIPDIDVYVHPEMIVSIDRLMDNFSKGVPEHLHKYIPSDFCLLSTMMGNDYLPKLQFVKFESLFDIYKNFIKKKNTHLITNGSIREDILMQFMFEVFNSLNTRFRKVNFNELCNSNIVTDYLKGLTWTLKMYMTGNCPMIDYIYKHKSAPNPGDIAYYLMLNPKTDIQCPISDIKPLNIDMYNVLVFPKKAKKLIPERFRKLIDNKLAFLYEEETCKTCKQIKDDYGKFYKQMKKYDNKSDEVKQIRKQIGEVSKRNMLHKKEHSETISIEKVLSTLSTT